MARRAFFIILLIALPGVLWQAFEMYGLTLFGAQMLFFSIVHTMPVLVAVVLIAVPFGLATLIQVAVALLLPYHYGARLGLPRFALVAIATFLSAHAIALVAYDSWSHTPLRIPVCVIGIALFGAAVSATLVALAKGREVLQGAA